MKRICCLLLCLLLCCPLASFAEEDGIRVEIRPHQADFAFDLPDYEFVYVNYDTRTDSGKMVLYAPDGHFAGSCALPATDGAVNLGINVYALNGKQIMRSTVTTAADMTSKGPVAGLEQVKVTNTARDVMILPIKGGLYYSFTAPGRDSVVLKYRSPQESHSLTLYAGEDYKYQGSVDMPYTYDDDKVTVAVLSSTGSELYSEILTAYVDTLRAIPQAEEGRLKGVTVCIDPGHQRTTKVETVPAAPNSIEMKTTVVGMAQGVETKRRESIVVLEIGLLLRKGLPQRVQSALMAGVGLCTLLIGMKGALGTGNQMLVILSVVLGAVVGALLKIEERLDRLGKRLEKRFAKEADGSFGKGFVTASLMFCVGAMAIVGSMDSGLRGDHSTLFAKSVLDGVISIVFASTLGPGVALSAAAVFLYQGSIALLSQAVAPLLTERVITEMSAVGGVLILGVGLNMLRKDHLPVGNLLPAVFAPLLLTLLIP